jgi:hypothetical protein
LSWTDSACSGDVAATHRANDTSKNDLNDFDCIKLSLDFVLGNPGTMDTFAIISNVDYQPVLVSDQRTLSPARVHTASRRQ